ncbi:MAG: hypothetical protein JKY00_14775 [Roseicyclus sp.]|nr:hypothetical protein [Roseicyclus sp.]
MPDHMRLILRHAAYGGVIAMAFIGALLVLNVGNLWHLVTHTTGGPLALVVMTVFCWITFGSVQIGIRIMTMGDDKGGGGTRAPEPLPLPIPLRVETRR